MTIASAGFLSPGFPPPPEVIESMKALGLDLSGHRSRLVEAQLLEEADLVVGMARQHVIDLTLLAPGSWVKCFTLADLLRRAEAVGPRQKGEEVTAWTKRIHGGRSRASLVGLSSADDIPDPMGGARQDYERVRDRLSLMTQGLAEFLVPV